MALTRRVYVDGETIITAQNLNDIQDEIISHGNTLVPKTRTVNGKALSTNITLSASDVSALPSSGGTLTGALNINGANETIKETRYSFLDNTLSNDLVTRGYYINDSTDQNIVALYGYNRTEGNGLRLQTRKLVGGSQKYNSLELLLDASGNPIVRIQNTEAARKAWRKALGLSYASGDTFATSNFASMTGELTGDAKKLRFIINVDKSLENISSVQVTRLTGTLRGVKGYLDSNSSDRDMTGTDFTVTTAIVSDKTIRIDVTKSTAFTNAVNNSPVAVALNVTFSFS